MVPFECACLDFGQKLQAEMARGPVGSQRRSQSVVRNYVVFKQLESKLLGEDPLKYRGAYLLVNSPQNYDDLAAR
jgi:hypothetical protein